MWWNGLGNANVFNNPIRRVSSGGIRVGYTNILDALAALSAGDGLELGVGVFSLGTTVMDLPARVTVTGSGAAGELVFGDQTKMGGTIITWGGVNGTQGAAVCPGDYNIIENLSIVGNATDNAAGNTQTPLGALYTGSATQKASVGVVVRGVYLFGNVDAVLVSRGSSNATFVQWDFFDSIFESGFDTFNLLNSTSSMLRAINCVANVDCSKITTPTSARCFSLTGGTIEVYGGKANIITGTTSGGGNVVSTLYAAGTGTMRVNGVGLRVDGAAATPFHFTKASSGNLYHQGCYTLDGADFLVSGAITQLASSTVMLTALDPKDGTAGNRPKATAAGAVCFYSGKLYVCTNASTPTWEAVTSA